MCGAGGIPEEKYRNKVVVEDFEGLVHLQRKCTRKGRMETKRV